MHADPLRHLIDSVAWPVDGQPDQVKVAAVHRPHGGPVSLIVTCREEIRGEKRQDEAAADGAVAGRFCDQSHLTGRYANHRRTQG